MEGGVCGVVRANPGRGVLRAPLPRRAGARVDVAKSTGQDTRSTAELVESLFSVLGRHSTSFLASGASAPCSRWPRADRQTRLLTLLGRRGRDGYAARRDMGQPITVTIVRGLVPSVRIFDLDRSSPAWRSSGTRRWEGHEGRPPDVLARRLFDLGATSVTVYRLGHGDGGAGSVGHARAEGHGDQHEVARGGTGGAGTRPAAPLAGELGDLVPGATLARGLVLRVTGRPGVGATTVGFELAAALTATGESAAAVDLHGTLGARAAEEAGVALERFAVVRRVSPTRWATVVAALLDGVSLVIADVQQGVSLGDTRRLGRPGAGARRGACGGGGGSSRGRVRSAFTVHAAGSAWERARRRGARRRPRAPGRRRVEVDGRGAVARPRIGELARAG